jgi:hypothetical protein
LVADTIEELHTFAEVIGLRRSWYQDHIRHPHYDIFGYKVGVAIRHGAVWVSTRKVVEVSLRLGVSIYALRQREAQHQKQREVLAMDVSSRKALNAEQVEALMQKKRDKQEARTSRRYENTFYNTNLKSRGK